MAKNFSGNSPYIVKFVAMPAHANVTDLVRKAQKGDREALDGLLPIIYDELRMIARKQLSKERPGHTLQPTALVHEAYMRLLEQTNVDWTNRTHFFSIASQMMRRILVNYANERNAQKRGNGATHVNFDNISDPGNEKAEFDILLLNDTLDRLGQLDEAQAKIVELRFFGGLTIEETAEVLSISPATVKREWTMARAWLQTQMQR